MHCLITVFISSASLSPRDASGAAAPIAAASFPSMSVNSSDRLPRLWRACIELVMFYFACWSRFSLNFTLASTLKPLSWFALGPTSQPIYSSSCLQQLGSRSGTLSACTTGTGLASGAAGELWAALRFPSAAAAPTGACAASLMVLESSAAFRRRGSRRPCPAGPGICQAHHL